MPNKVFHYLNIAEHGLQVYVLKMCVRALAMENISRSSSWLHDGGDAGMKTKTLTGIAPSPETRWAFVHSYVFSDCLKMLVRDAAKSLATTGCCAVACAEFLPYAPYDSVCFVYLQTQTSMVCVDVSQKCVLFVDLSVRKMNAYLQFGVCTLCSVNVRVM